jgi:predicted nucleotidyltransferase
MKPDLAHLLNLVPPDLWGLWTHGQFSPNAKTDAEQWLRHAIKAYPSIRNATEEWGLTPVVHTQLCRFMNGELTDEPLPRFVLFAVQGLRKRAGLKPLAEPEIRGDTAEHVRRRVRWAKLVHYKDYGSDMAEKMGISRTYLAHFLRDPRRSLTGTLLAGFFKAGFRPEWVKTGQGQAHRGESDGSHQGDLWPERTPPGKGSPNKRLPSREGKKRTEAEEERPTVVQLPPAQTRREVLDRLAVLRKPLRSLGFRRVGLFGSFRHDRARPDSDVDLLVEFEPGTKTFDNFMGAADLLEDALGRRVELVTKDGLSPYIGPKILADVEYFDLTG